MASKHPPQKKPQKRSWILLEDSPGGSRLFAMETERCQRMESPKIPSFWGSGVEPQAPSFPSAWKNRWNGGIRARGAEGFGVGTQQSPPRLNLNLFGIKQTPKSSVGANPRASVSPPRRSVLKFSALEEKGF